MSRFYEQNIDVILEMDALNKHIKDLRQYYELEHIFVVSTPAARERGIQSILETAGYIVTMWGEQYGDLTEPTNDQILEAYKEFAHSDADCVFAIIEASLRKRNDAYRHIDTEKLLQIFEFYIDDWELYQRYLPKHSDLFVETAIANANYNSHPVELDADDFRWIFETTLQRAKDYVEQYT